MKTKIFYIFSLIFLTGACEVEVDGGEGKKVTPIIDQLPAYTGRYTQSVEALSGTQWVDCDMDLRIKQSKKTVEFKKFEFDCDDGSTTEFDLEAFELRKSKDQTLLAYDVYYQGNYVGWMNYSNSYFTASIEQAGSQLNIALSKTKNTTTLEKAELIANGYVVFRLVATDIQIDSKE